jgi:hypothetical protein
MNRPDDLKMLEEGKPFIRSIAAFIVYLRYGSTWPVDTCYKKADEFIGKLKDDLT